MHAINQRSTSEVTHDGGIFLPESLFGLVEGDRKAVSLEIVVEFEEVVLLVLDLTVAIDDILG